MKMEEKIFILIHSRKIPMREIERHTGFDESMLYKLRRGDRKIMNLTIATGRKFEEYFDYCESINIISKDDITIAKLNYEKLQNN